MAGAFEQAPPYIYETMKLGGQIEKISQRDWIGIFSGMESLGFNWDPMTSQLRQLAAFPILQSNSPWCHASSSPGKHCGMDHNIIFNNFKIIHPRCMSCWKVCMTIENFDHLRQIEKMQLEQQKEAKCGIELRDYTPKHYGAYWYTSSIDAGMERYHEVVKDVTRLFGKKYAEKNILLKRACTEYEMVKGPSAFWFNTLEEDRTLDIIDAYVCVPRNNVDQPEMIKNHIRLRQALWAHANGDMSYVPYNGGHKFFPGYMTYHDKNIDDIKHDIALAVGMQHGINPETGAAFVAMAEDFKNANNVDKIGDLAHLLGMQQNNPINMLQGATTMTQEVPSELKTEIT